MARRNKKIKKSLESIEKEIEVHFQKLEKDIQEGNLNRGSYHFKEIDKSLIFALEKKVEFLNLSNNSVIEYRRRLDILRKKLE
jgi:hypothetical protein